MIKKCDRCNGKGTLLKRDYPVPIGSPDVLYSVDCPECEGKGQAQREENQNGAN